MTHEYILWIATIAYGFHMIEETVYDWHGWVRRVLKLQAEWHEFYMVNAVVIVLGAGCAMVGWRCPAVALLFHVLPVLVTRIFSPGLFTAVILFLPVTAWLYRGASQDGVLTTGAVLVSSIMGFLLMMFPIVLQKTKRLPFFRQQS